MLIGKTMIFESKPAILSFASVAGKKESEGPFGKYFDICGHDSFFGENSFEKAESKLQKLAVEYALKKATLNFGDVDCIFAGDLLNQCIGSSFGLRDFGIPICGLYGACSTMALSIINACVQIEAGLARRTVSVTSSHFCSAERQYRFPLEYGSQRPPTAQWTATASGAVVLTNEQQKAYIDKATIGKICDLGVKDAGNMGAAMAPAAADTIRRFFVDTRTRPQDYSAIFTGDLGYVGSTLLYELLDEDGINIRENHNDCGMMIFDREGQDVHAGGSGCGCSASILTGFILKEIENGHLPNVLFCATGALLSPTSTQQGDTIPCVAHLINIRKND